MIELDARADRRRGRRRDRRPRWRRADPSAASSTRAGRRRAISSSACPASTLTAAGSPPRRSTTAPGAWSSMPQHAEALLRAGRVGLGLRGRGPACGAAGLARGWRRELGCPVVGITGSTGKTSVKDIAARAPSGPRPREPGELQHRDRPAARAPRRAAGTEVLVLEMAMRGMGQIAELCEIAEPDVAAITNVGPVHLELLGTLEAIAEAKAEILGGLGTRGGRSCPVDAEALEPHLARHALDALTFGPGGDVSRRLERRSRAADGRPDRHARGRGALRLPVRRGPQPRERALRDRDRRRARRRSGGPMARGAAA